MGTIIIHGKCEWNKSKKNKRVDKELEEELSNYPTTDTKKVFEEIKFTQKITKNIQFGETHILDSTNIDLVNSKILNCKSFVDDNKKTDKEEINNVDIFDNSENIDLLFIEDIDDLEEKLRLLNGS